ncbi:MAG: hypothetical protein MSH24_09670, partial [Lachnospiraceae bacterium]|nr:hypothetical protein [Lachnospiraceae bacterium]
VYSPNPASFRSHLTVDTLAFGYVLPTTGRTPDLHQLETCAAERTKNNEVNFIEINFIINYQIAYVNISYIRFLTSFSTDSTIFIIS